jgi:uncharacterized membrane protein
MEQQPGFASFIPLIILTLPIVFINVSLAKRKGKSLIAYGLLSLIPIVGIYFGIFLASLTDKSLNEKIDKIISLLDER